MDWSLFSLEQVHFFLLLFVRIVTTLMLVPIFGTRSVPVMAKVALSLLITVILFSSMNTQTFPELDHTLSFGFLVLLVLKEALVGLAIGFIASLLFVAVQFAGRLIDTEMGFGFVELVDPASDQPVTTFGQLQIILFSILFLLFNGHYFLLLALHRSFDLIPLTGVQFAGDQIIMHVTKTIGQLFVLAIRLAAPIYVVLILTEISLGVIARTVPQINIFFVGLPLKILVGLSTACIVLPVLATLFRHMVEALIQDIWRLLYMMA